MKGTSISRVGVSRKRMQASIEAAIRLAGGTQEALARVLDVRDSLISGYLYTGSDKKRQRSPSRKVLRLLNRFVSEAGRKDLILGTMFPSDSHLAAIPSTDKVSEQAHRQLETILRSRQPDVIQFVLGQLEYWSGSVERTATPGASQRETATVPETKVRSRKKA